MGEQRIERRCDVDIHTLLTLQEWLADDSEPEYDWERCGADIEEAGCANCDADCPVNHETFNRWSKRCDGCGCRSSHVEWACTAGHEQGTPIK